MEDVKQRELAWEVCPNPFQYTDEELADFQGGYEDEDGSMEEHKPKIDGILTQIGFIPITEHSDPFKIFKFFTGHTNFKITQKVAHIINMTDGVETLNIWSPYRFRIAIGKCFSSSQVKNDVMIRLNAKVSKHVQESIRLGESEED